MVTDTVQDKQIRRSIIQSVDAIEELKQHVTFLHCWSVGEVEMDDETSCEEVEWATAYSGKQIVILA